MCTTFDVLSRSCTICRWYTASTLNRYTSPIARFCLPWLWWSCPSWLLCRRHSHVLDRTVIQMSLKALSSQHLACSKSILLHSEWGPMTSISDCSNATSVTDRLWFCICLCNGYKNELTIVWNGYKSAIRMQLKLWKCFCEDDKNIK